MIRYIALLACAFTYSFAQSPNNAPPASRTVDVDGHKMWMQVSGVGPKAVVFDAGIGEGHRSWRKVESEVGKFARVVSYDRAGIGESEPGPEPRSYSQVATELHTLLHKGGIAPPYILVGHSLGGAHVRAFAKLYKDEVAGLVLVDPLNAAFVDLLTGQQLKTMLAQQEAAIRTPGGKAEWSFAKTEVANHFEQLRSFGAPPDVPTVLLIGAQQRPDSVKAELQEYGKWIAEASEGSMIVTADSKHYIQNDQPSLVIEAIRRVVFPSSERLVQQAAREKGPAAAIARYRELKQHYPPEYMYERTLYNLAVQQFREHHLEEAIALMKANVEMYPASADAFEALGQAYSAHGDRDLAIANFRKAVELDPQNTSVQAKLKQLESKPAP